MVLFGPIWSSMVLHEVSNNYASQHEITHNSIRKLEMTQDMLDSALRSMLYHKIAIDSLFSSKLYPRAPTVRLVIFYLVMTSPGATKCSGSDSLSTLLTLFSSARDMSTGIM